MLREHVGGLVATKNVKINEQIAIFLIIFSHHTKNQIVKCNFKRSGYTISKHFNKVLEAILKLHAFLLANPQAIPEACTDERWKWFKGFLGALDGTYIPIKVPPADKAHYRNRKGHIAVNVLGVCDRDMKFQYVLMGWEGSACDSRVLRDAIHKQNGLKIRNGARTMRNKSWTHFKHWIEIYGKDRATGENVQAFPDAVQDLLNRNNEKENENGGEHVPTFHHNEYTETSPMSSTRGDSNASGSKSSRKRKSIDASDDAFIELDCIMWLCIHCVVQ
ncbi:hypothetical protein BUALT_Bualt04G0021500 [Buddleja alternifolia]|uniref:Transposase n=1 Tax=Buddleja alternifolia TaxID=168488 RepID=A0AAV6XW99_9LAMI|nr:hypothetical protein BUALT_Bualt04G0021500 [Buddleja alternifolia]